MNKSSVEAYQKDAGLVKFPNTKSARRLDSISTTEETTKKKVKYKERGEGESD